MQPGLTIHSRCTSKQQLFPNFVLEHYVSSGVRNLAQEKRAPCCAFATTTRSPMPGPTPASPSRSASCLPASSGSLTNRPADRVQLKGRASASTASGAIHIASP